jgi:hypothetical protein
MKNYKQGFAPLLIIILVVAIGAGGYYYSTMDTAEVTPTEIDKPIMQVEVDTSTYVNTKYRYQFSFPSFYRAYEQDVSKGKGTPLVQVLRQGDRDLVVISENNLTIPDAQWGSNIIIERQNGDYFIKGSKTVDDYWNRLAKTNDSGELVNKFTSESSIDGVKFIFFQQKENNEWLPQALFYHNGNFFWVRGTDVSQKEFNEIVATFKFTK